MTQSVPPPAGKASYSFTIQTPEFRNLPIPGVPGSAKVGDCYVRVTDLPARLDDFMEVNPRVPKRTQKGVLSGPVPKAILETLRERPSDMALKNQGIYLLVAESSFNKESGGVGKLTLQFDDRSLHGIVNGGHTYAAIRDAIENADKVDKGVLEQAFVRLHVLQGIDREKVADIAEGLNRSKQVDDPSLANLRGFFDEIKGVMRGQMGEKAIAYNQGEDGELYITQLLVYLQLFNGERYSEDKHPHSLYRKPSEALKSFEADLVRRKQKDGTAIELLIPRIPEILRLADEILLRTKKSAKRSGFEFGRMKVGKKMRAGSSGAATQLPFINKTMDYRVPKGWLSPMLAAFRANTSWDITEGRFEWIVPLKKLIPAVIDSLVNVCVVEHRDNNLPPEAVGKRESTYRQCYDKIVIYLARQGKLDPN